MTTPRAGEILRAPGRLCINPTNLNIDFPFGGQDLGVIKNIVVKPGRASYQIKAEEFGIETTDIVDGGESWVLGALLRNYDNIAIAKLFPNTSIGASTKVVITHNSTDVNRAGHLISSRSVKLLFASDAPSRDPFCLFYKALPLVGETAEFNLNLNVEMGLEIWFYGVRDDNNKVIQKGMKGDIVL